MKFSSQNQGGNDSGYLSAFNFSSLTDIVMLLLIFFLLTSSFVTTKGISVATPEAANSTQQQDQRVVVSVNAEGIISMNDTETTKEELPGLLSAQLKADSANSDSTIVVLRADKALPYDEVINILDIIKGAGATKFFLATEKPKEGS